MRKILFGLLWYAATLSQPVSAASNFVFSDEPGPYAVGLRVVQQYDYARAYKGKTDLTTGQPTTGERARPIQTLVWYPAQKGGKPLTYEDYVLTTATEEEFGLTAVTAEQKKQAADAWFKNMSSGIGMEQAEQERARHMGAARDAMPASGKFPVVVYAPSLSAPAYENADLCEYLASQGYVVIASPGMGSHTRSMTIDLDGIEAQVADIEYLIGYAHTLPQADSTRIAVVGYSWGGISNVFAAARDSRIAALVALDGSVRYHPKLVQEANYVTPARVAVPMLYLAARPMSIEEANKYKLDVSDSFLNKMAYSDLYKVTLYPMRHQDFSSMSLRFASGANFSEYSQDEISRAYGWMARYVHRFLDATLKNDAAAVVFMRNSPAGNAVPAHLLTVDMHRAEGAPPTMETLAVECARRGFDHVADVVAELHKQDEQFKPAERSLNGWGYQLLAQNKNKEAIAILAFATTLYPDSGNAYDSLAEAYESGHYDALAIANYRRSLTLTPDNEHAVQHLKALGAP